LTDKVDNNNTWENAVCWLRAQPDKQEMVRASYYDDPIIGACQRYHASNEWHAVQEILLGRTGNALDIGAGFGIASYALARDGFNVTALEPDPSDLVGAGAIRNLAHESSLPITVIENVSEAIPLPDNSMDIVFARAVLHHAQNLNAAMREFNRVLKPGGLFLAIREHVISRDDDLPVFLENHPLHALYGGEHAYTADVYVSAMQAGGLQVQKILKPLENAVNYAPHTRAGVNRQIAEKFGERLGGTAIIEAVMRLPLLGDMALKIAGRFDHRPGRHYSFIATKG
jgi:SAM-dependent methyltransferase